MKFFICFIFSLAIVMGCSPRRLSLDDEITKAPDSWSSSWKFGASSNNWALLERVSRVDDTHERIRLTASIRDHFKHSAARDLAECTTDASFDIRMTFLQACAYRLIEDADPHAVLAGWNLMAMWLDDLEQLAEVTGKAWNNGVYNRHAPQKEKAEWGFASKVRQTYDQYFKYSFNVQASYKRLPESIRSAFVEQIKRDFFHRKGMAFVDLSAFPPEFRE